MGSEVPVPDSDGSDPGTDGIRYTNAERVEGSGGDGAERGGGSCASGLFDTSEVFGVFVSRISEGEVGDQTVEELPEAVKTREPWFAYDAFGDSNINFWVWLYATDRIGSFRVKSELIKRLHVRFSQEGITINYPVRLLAYEDSKGTMPPLPSDIPSY